MTGRAHSRRKRKAAPRARAGWAPWAALGLGVVTLLFLASVGPGRLPSLLARLTAPRTQGPLSLTVLHTNDTWGFIYPCG